MKLLSNVGRALVASAIVGVSLIATAPAAMADPPRCLGQTSTAPSLGGCTMDIGETVAFTVIAGTGGDGLDDVSPGVVGGVGGPGAKITGEFTNTSGSLLTLVFVVGADGIAASSPGSPDGTNGSDSWVTVGGVDVIRAVGGAGGKGGVNGGAAGASGASLPGNLVPTGAVLSSAYGAKVSFTAPATPEVPASPAATPVRVTVGLDGNGGSCAVSSLSGDAGVWAALPVVADCSNDGTTLTGWRTRDGELVFAPGASINLTGDNTLFAVWSVKATSGSTAAPVPPLAPHLVIWRTGSRGTVVLAFGDPAGLAGRTATFTIAAKDSSRVNATAIAQAKELATTHGGVFAGVVPANSWMAPRIVAAFQR